MDYFITIWYILRPFGIFFVLWYIILRLWYSVCMYQEKSIIPRCNFETQAAFHLFQEQGRANHLVVVLPSEIPSAQVNTYVCRYVEFLTCRYVLFTYMKNEKAVLLHSFKYLG
jgi:hypothetical protein